MGFRRTTNILPTDAMLATGASLGIDVGSVSVKVVWCDALGSVLWSSQRPSQGRPLRAVVELLRCVSEELGPDALVRVAVTGSGRDLVAQGARVAVVNEVMAAARGACALVPHAATVVDLGGQFSKWIRLGTDGEGEVSVEDFSTNGKCAAGSGAFVEQQAARMDVDAERLGELARGASRAATVAGRCSVFAKSDMIHLQQKGTPVEEIALGLCHAMVRTFLGTVVAGAKLEPPVVLVGGGGASAGIARAFHEVARLEPHQVVVPSMPIMACALGAAMSTRDVAPQSVSDVIRALAARVDAGVQAHEARDPLPRLPVIEDSFAGDEAPEVLDSAMDVVLGVDVGSVSTNLVIATPDGTLVHGEYLATRGQPSDVILDGMRAIARRLGTRIHVTAVGATGSGRHLAAAMLGADVVHNEITAQMISALHFVPEADTIFEIGGQDAKYISIREGRLADFEMNKICSAGTGSFLEEQARRLNVAIIEEFARHAFGATAPCDLGTQCTVFMDAELVRAQQDGTSVEDLCAGLAYSVARNYLDRVVGGRPVGRHIVFQGGTASNRAVVAAFRQLLGRDVRVHPYNRLSGALGVALLAARQARTLPTRFKGFDTLVRPAVKTFECRTCENRCQVSRVNVAGGVVHFGDACERHAERDGSKQRGPRPFPELFEARQALLEEQIAPYREERPGAPRVGLLHGSTNAELLPFWMAFLHGLGWTPVLPPRADARLLSRYPGGVPSEVCLPIKASVAQARALVEQQLAERVFVPDVMEFPEPGGPSVSCMYAHHLGEMLRPSIGDALATAKVRLSDGMLGLVDEGMTLSSALGVPADAVMMALRAGKAAQASFDRARRQLGREALDADFDRAVVVLGKPYNTHDAFLNLSLARHLDRLGIAAIPWDLFPAEEVVLPERWRALPWKFNRDQLRVLTLARRDPRLFPIWVSSFGCGPDGFTSKHLEQLLAGRPRLLLEFDEHRGEAGLVTRLEAFADELDAFQGATKRPRARGKTVPGRTSPAPKRFVIPHFSDHARIYESSLRAVGYDVLRLPWADEASTRLGEENGSGRECHAYTMMLGDLLRAVHAGWTRKGDVYFFPNAENPCLIQQYGDGMRLALSRLGITSPVVWDGLTEDLSPLVGTAGMFRLYEGLFAVDVLLTLSTRLRAYESEAGETDRVLESGLCAVAAEVQARGSVADALAAATLQLWSVPRKGVPWDRPVVGVTGDVFTRTNPVENGDLWKRLESMGCEVWPSTYLAQLADLGALRMGRWMLRRWELRGAVHRRFNLVLSAGVRHRLLRCLPGPARALVEEPDADRLFALSRPYVDEWASPFVLDGVAKTADFLERGVSGVVVAVGLNCMAGVAMSAVMPAMRADHGQVPVLTLSCGGAEGPGQRIRLETFVEQVHERWRRTRRAGAQKTA